MGKTYCLGDPQKEEYIDIGCKRGEIHNSYPEMLITEWVAMKGMRPDSPIIQLKWFTDADYDQYKSEWKDVTCDVLISLFEGGWQPKGYWDTGMIHMKFKDCKRLNELSEWIKKW